MKKPVKVIIIIVSIILVIILAGFIFFKTLEKKTINAVNSQVYTDIDMSKVADGTYSGESDGGLVFVEVSVTVKDHAITNIDLLQHKNGKGKPAEAMLDDMVKNNTYDVDIVSGATMSSKTIKNAVNKALAKGLTGE